MSLAVAGAISVAPSAANAEVAASVAVSNMYLWRGYDLGNGSAAVSGDLTYSNSGFYTGVWASSGDSSWGTEYDLFAGYGAEFSGFSVDLSFWNYMYPSAPDEVLADTGGVIDDFGGLTDAVLSLGFAGFSVAVYDNIAGGSGNAYYTLSYSYDAFSILIGKHDVRGPEMDFNDDGELVPTGTDMTHVNISYAYNDNLSFTFSQQVDGEVDNDLKFVLNYSLPIEM